MITDEDLLVKRNPASWLVAASLFAYVTSFFLPTYGDPNHQYLLGAHAFVIALASLEDGKFFWLANPSYWFAIVWLFRGTTDARPLVFSMVALLTAACVVYVLDVRSSLGSGTLLPGYYTWLLSFGFGVAASSIELCRCRSSERAASVS